MRDQGRSENPVMMRNKHHYLVKRVPLRKHAISQYALLQVSTIHYIPRNSNLNLKQNSSGCGDYDEQN